MIGNGTEEGSWAAIGSKRTMKSGFGFPGSQG